MVILISLLVACPLRAATESSGGAWAFLKTGIGARAMGMGGAFVAVADDATAAYWNPAGLGMLDKRELTLMVIDLLNRDIYPLANSFPRTHQYLSGILPTRIGRFGLSWNDFRIGDIQYTTGTSELDFKKHDKLFDDRERALNFSYGFSYPNLKNPDSSWFFLGGNIRVMNQSFFKLSTTGFGGDVGFILRSKRLGGLRNIRLGWVWNVNLPRKWSSLSSEIKVSESYLDPAVIGWKWGFAFDTKELKSTILTPAFTLTYRQKGSPVTYSAGVEIKITRSVFIRFGSEDVIWKKNPLKDGSETIGCGLKTSYLQLDYATSFEDLDTRHRISTTVWY